MLISLANIALTLGGKTLFRDLNLAIQERDRLGLVGPNGSGKTSLLKLLVGEHEADRGDLGRKRGVRVGYLPQELTLDGDGTLLDFVRRSVPGRDELQGELEKAEAELAGAGDESGVVSASTRLADLHERIARFEQDYADHVALRILAGLGFAPADRERDLSEFSGGWKMRAVLASFLFSQPDLMLMDEPTNHLDMPSVAWFSGFLKRYGHAFVLISHDKEFLNEQVTRVASFEPEGVRTYQGNYDQYQKLRSQETEVLENRARNLQREREKIEAFINSYRYDKKKSRLVQSRIKALERMETVETLGSHQSVHFRFPPTERTSKQALKVERLAKSYGDQTVFSGVNLSATRGEKIGIIGVNGAGKTTLLKIIAGELEADQGEILFGHHVKAAYYAQHHAETLHSPDTVFESVARAAAGKTATQIRTLLGALLFSGDDIDKRIGVLSGGEKARVALARVLATPCNLLLMDEPTNSLDIISSDRLGEALDTFDGTLVFVSHNRAFVRRLANRIWNIEGGKVETYPGSLDDYLDSAMRRLEVSGENTDQLTRAPVSTSLDNGAAKKGSRDQEKERKRREAEVRALRRRRLGSLQDRVAELEAEIATLEAEQAERSAWLANPEIFSDPEQGAALMRDHHDATTRLEELTGEWEALALELETKTAELDAELGDPS